MTCLWQGILFFRCGANYHSQLDEMSDAWRSEGRVGGGRVSRPSDNVLHLSAPLCLALSRIIAQSLGDLLDHAAATAALQWASEWEQWFISSQQWGDYEHHHCHLADYLPVSCNNMEIQMLASTLNDWYFNTIIFSAKDSPQSNPYSKTLPQR